MASKHTSAGSPQTGTFGEEAADLARDAKDAMFDAARAATRSVDDGRTVAAERLEGVASTIGERVDDLPGGHKVKEFAQAAADRLSTTADYMRSHDARRMMADLETVVRNNPGPSLLIAAALGFMVGRALVRD
jgi:ElaB/YqjD/DUF883 family membrane-anchored ribosome-binding protein